MKENSTKELKKSLAEELEGKSYDEIGDFFDTHSLADYWEDTEEVDVEIGPTIKRSRKLTPEEKEAIKAGGPVPKDLVINDE
ncbi:MAG: hypothetical protein AB1489_29300 [Acidobacteriota bacterium]